MILLSSKNLSGSLELLKLSLNPSLEYKINTNMALNL